MFPYHEEMLECVKLKDEKLYSKLMRKLKVAKYMRYAAGCVFLLLLCGELVSRIWFKQEQASTIIFVVFAALASMSFAFSYYMDLLSRMLEFEFRRD